MQNHEEPKQPARILSFVRRGGRMTVSQERAWEQHREHYLLELERGGAATGVAPGQTVDVAGVYGREAPLVVEIGSGQGHAILHAAASHPERNFLAVEVYRGGLARTILRAEAEGITNLRMIEANAPEVLEHALPAGSVSELWVFFPDPWHKTKHHKRRLINPPFLTLAHRALAADGVLRLATDWEEYALHMREVLDASPLFERAFEGEWAERFDGRIETAFERKGKEKGREIRDLTYRAVAG